MIRFIQVTVETLTPLHIGTGEKLLRDFDYVARNGRTYRLDLGRLVETLYVRDPQIRSLLLRRPPGEFLKADDLREGSPFVRYVLAGEPQGNEFREQIKDAQDRVYLPGSSLKGALRTVLAWHGWQQLSDQDRNLEKLTAGERQAKFAARKLEQHIFGGNPNRDLLRALRISDSASLPGPGEGLRLEVVKVWTPRGPGVPISVEAVPEGVRFSMEASLDLSLFSEWASQNSDFPLKHRDWLESLGQLAAKRAVERLKEEQGWWQQQLQQGTNPYDWVQQRIYTKLGPQNRGFPLQLGFGTGWAGTTIGAPLKQAPGFSKVYERFQLSKAPRGAKAKVEDFPTSRRVVVRGSQLLPLGWVWVEWKEVVG